MKLNQRNIVVEYIGLMLIFTRYDFHNPGIVTFE